MTSKQEKYRKKKTARGPALSFYISEETKVQLDELKRYARKQGISFSYEQFFSMWAELASELTSDEKNDGITFQDIIESSKTNFYSNKQGSAKDLEDTPDPGWESTFDDFDDDIPY